MTRRHYVRLGYPERSTLTARFHENSGYVQRHPKGALVYSRYRFLDSRQTLQNMLDAIDDARHDPRVAGIALNLSGTVLTRGQAWEIRERLGDFRAAGKKVVVYLDEAGLSSYYVASVADHIVMDEEGLIMLPGYVMGRTYVASMLEKLGVGFEEFRFLKYKTAVENLARHEMSEADREQRQALVDQYYTTFRDDVAAGRHVSAEAVDRWVNDQTLFTSASALESKLVDEIGRWDEVKERVKQLEGERKRCRRRRLRPLVSVEAVGRARDDRRGVRGRRVRDGQRDPGTQAREDAAQPAQPRRGEGRGGARRLAGRKPARVRPGRGTDARAHEEEARGGVAG
jgi:protease-4